MISGVAVSDTIYGQNYCIFRGGWTLFRNQNESFVSSEEIFVSVWCFCVNSLMEMVTRVVEREIVFDIIAIATI
ncbi:hypothetical protein [Bacillus sp. FJAT-45350]|uniref:hypothetical protein n=1 Tax=Bacillus sp. FJAT-45350 TaxID=2011014 RepID=UPI000BB6A673|nr:hypothetical protein [Bacillus sp. FJAT-45350]